MKARLIALFDRLETVIVSRENARAVAIARQIVECSEIVTYDDYVNAVAAVATDPPLRRNRASRSSTP